MKITEDFIGNETKELTKTKIATILRWWGFNPDSYSTWGNARVDMNNILSGSSSSTISDRERASSFLSKINYINDTDAVISDMLFAANEPGVWFDPTDLSTLFQDAAGTTPVTAVEQPVGLMLDKSKGLVRGVDLKGETFAEGAGWSFSGGIITAVAASAFSTSSNTGFSGFVANRSYLIEYDVLSVSAGAFRWQSAGGTSTVNNSTVGLRSEVYVPTVNSAWFNIQAASGGFTGAVRLLAIRELPGNHAYQTTATSRPVLSARVNLLTKTEQFDDAYWVKVGVTVTANAAAAPNGEQTAALVTTTAANTVQVIVNPAASYGSAQHTLSFYVRSNGWRWIQLRTSVALSNSFANLDVIDGVKGTESGLTSSIQPIASGWFRVSITVTTAAASGDWALNFVSASNSGRNTSVTGDGTSGIYIWGADLRVANDGANLPPYQRVNTATDYDTAGFPHYLRFDGVDDWLVTNTITPGTDKVQVFAGVRKQSNPIGGAILAETSTSASDNSGAFWVATTVAASNNYGFRSGGTNRPILASRGVTSPSTNILTGISDISGDSAILRVNSAQVAQSTADQGTVNYLAYPLYIGRRGGTTLPFNGHLYSLIVRFGSNLPTATIVNTEKYINGLTKAY